MNVNKLFILLCALFVSCLWTSVTSYVIDEVINDKEGMKLNFEYLKPSNKIFTTTIKPQLNP